jgi:hypothetical protein
VDGTIQEGTKKFGHKTWWVVQGRESSTIKHGRLSVWDIVTGIVCKKGIAKDEQFWGVPAHAGEK